MLTFRNPEDKTRCIVLNLLKTKNQRSGAAREERVTVVKTRKDESRYQCSSSFSSHVLYDHQSISMLQSHQSTQILQHTRGFTSCCCVSWDCLSGSISWACFSLSASSSSTAAFNFTSKPCSEFLCSSSWSCSATWWLASCS